MMTVTGGGMLRVTNDVGWNTTLGLMTLDATGLVIDGGTFAALWRQQRPE